MGNKTRFGPAPENRAQPGQKLIVDLPEAVDAVHAVAVGVFVDRPERPVGAEAQVAGVHAVDLVAVAEVALGAVRKLVRQGVGRVGLPVENVELRGRAVQVLGNAREVSAPPEAVAAWVESVH